MLNQKRDCTKSVTDILCFKSITIEDKKNTKEQKECGLCDKAIFKGRVTEKVRSEQRYRLAETVYII